jgi:hypothetical protein
MQLTELVAVLGRDPVEERPFLDLLQRGRRQHGETGGIHFDQDSVG